MKNTIIRGMPALLLLVFGLVMAACSPLSGGESLSPEEQEPPLQDYVTLNLTIGEAEAARDVRIEMTRPSLAASNSRAARVAVGEYAYQMYLENVLIQTGFVTVTDAAGAGQEYEFTPATTALPEGDAEKSFKLNVVLGETAGETVITKADDKPIEVTEEQQEDGTFTLDILIAAGIVPNDVATLEDASDVVEEALEGEVEDSSGGTAATEPPPPAPPVVTAAIAPALKSKLQGTWILRDPDNHRNALISGASEFYTPEWEEYQMGGPHGLTNLVPEGGTRFTISGEEYEGSQLIHIRIYHNAPANEELWANLSDGDNSNDPSPDQTVTDRPPYVETGAVVYKTTNGKNIVTVSGRIPPEEIDLYGPETVEFEVKFLSNTVIQLIGDDAETLYLAGNTWDKE